VDVADRCVGELASPGGSVWVLWLAGDTEPLQAAMQAGSGELWVLSPRHPRTSSRDSRVRRRNSKIMAPSAMVRTVL